MYYKVRVISQSKESSCGVKDDVCLVHTIAPAERGMANAEMLALAQQFFETASGRHMIGAGPLSRIRIKIVSGHHHPHKIINVEEVS